MSVTRINEFHAAPDKARALHDFLSGVIHIIREAPGCRSVELLVGHDDEAQLAIIEVWDSIDAHRASAARIPPAKLAEVQPLLAAPPRGQYYRHP
jgi:quinol monooxygenase YgiN